MQPLILLSFLVLYWSSVAAKDTLAPAKIAKTQLPVTVKYRGTFHYAWKWNDKIGENWLITSTVKPYRPDKFVQNHDEKTAELHAYHFVKNDRGYKLVWSLSDAVQNCPFDITLECIDSAFKFTDLDNDGIAESKLQYKIVCTSDVSPSGMKLVMHEHATKYALRGFMWLPQGPEHK